MPGTLYVVATPIGNLEDVTLRAVRILREVSLIAAEDTRRTAKLLQHYSISTRTTSLHAHNEYARVPHLIDRLKAGESIALVSDAGTPGVSDPGARLVSAAHESGVTVQPVPGASAVTALVSAAGLGDQGFVFAGFAPSRASHRIKWLRELAREPRPVVFYEAPHRIIATLEAMAAELGDRTVAIGRELTKIHESLTVRPIKEWVRDPPPAQGEFAIAWFPARQTGPERAATPTPREIADEFGRTAEIGGSTRRDQMRDVASRLGVRVKDVFEAVERFKNSGT